MLLIINLFTLTGATVVFAQFPISQFRAIAWFNVAVGLLFILLQLLLFQGESQCTKLPRISCWCWNSSCTLSSITCKDLPVSLRLITIVITVHVLGYQEFIYATLCGFYCLHLCSMLYI